MNSIGWEKLKKMKTTTPFTVKYFHHSGLISFLSLSQQVSYLQVTWQAVAGQAFNADQLQLAT